MAGQDAHTALVAIDETLSQRQVLNTLAGYYEIDVIVDDSPPSTPQLYTAGPRSNGLWTLLTRVQVSPCCRWRLMLDGYWIVAEGRGPTSICRLVARHSQVRLEVDPGNVTPTDPVRVRGYHFEQ